MIIGKPCVEVLHLIAKLLDIVDHDESIGCHLREGSEEIVEILALHRIDIDEIEILICERGNHGFRIPPDGMNMFYLAIAKVFDRFDVCIPGVFDRGNRKFLPIMNFFLENPLSLPRIRGRRYGGKSRNELEGGITVRSADFEDMFRFFLTNKVLDKFRIFFGNIGNTPFETRGFEGFEIIF